VQKDSPMLKEEVDEEDIGKLVSKWTGIPVGRLLEGEAQKLVHMEERLRQRVIGQDDALARVATRCGAAGRGFRMPSDQSARSFFWGRRALAKPNWRGRWLNFCSTTTN